MRFRTLVGGLLAAFLLGGAVTPALAQYPPSVGAGKVTRSELKQCQCTNFSGEGFAPGASITITDVYPDGSRHVVQTVVADSKGGFKTKVCFDEHAPQGRHTLVARGDAAGGKGKHEVRSDVTVAGSVCYQKGDEVHGTRFERGTGGLPKTGSDTTVPALLLGFGLVVAGSGVVLVYRRRPYAVRS
ncbi:MAG TPA: LPXTG cell wall anchor domain-containing protein [Mycobacteriales bacterium]|nr:LPXTG cell wall anchor domain-containing protein [Mycobacteriales bacterium]